MIRDAAFWTESVKPSIDSVISRFVKVGAMAVYPAGKWYVRVASAFSTNRLLSRLIRLSLPNTVRGGKRAINCGMVACPQIV